MFRRSRKQIREIAPDEIFLDSSNLPDHNPLQIEGRVIRPVSHRSVVALGVVFFLLTSAFSFRAFNLQVAHGETYAQISRDNTLDRSVVFATRGVIRDRTHQEIAWNDIKPASDATTTEMFAFRRYTQLPGLAHILGFVRYPKADAKGLWWREDYVGISGVEYSFDSLLHGENGSRMIETDAHGHIERENIVVPPQNGKDVILAIDAQVQSKLYSILSQHADVHGFQGGAAIIMDVRTGELIALTSFPEYDNVAFTEGDVEKVKAASNDPQTPLLNRAVSGLYAPGSIVKPIFAAAALNEGIISPEKTIVSTGALTLPNPYDPSKPSIFRDWTVHGAVDMRTAIAVSSDEYFYTIGGGFGSQRGLGIARIDSYSRMFGLATTTGIDLQSEQGGVIPTPEWKEKVFEGDPWRIGDTYHTAIGQYGFQMTPLQAVRFTAAIANGGKLLKPQLMASSSPEFTQIDIPDKYLQIVREGMRLAVTSSRHDATVKSLYLPQIRISAKTGTAQIGTRNQYMNSWNVGFWPAEDPHYAYAVVLEKAPAGTLSGAAPALLPFFQWLIETHPEYLR